LRSDRILDPTSSDCLLNFDVIMPSIPFNCPETLENQGPFTRCR